MIVAPITLLAVVTVLGWAIWDEMKQRRRRTQSEQTMTDWPELRPNDLVLYQNDVDRPNRLVLSKSVDGYSLRIDTPFLDTRSAPALTRAELIDIAIKMIRATR
jgi:hypothetical protein